MPGSTHNPPLLWSNLRTQPMTRTVMAKARKVAPAFVATRERQ
jgi:hypothetical protein